MLYVHRWSSMSAVETPSLRAGAVTPRASWSLTLRRFWAEEDWCPSAAVKRQVRNQLIEVCTGGKILPMFLFSSFGQHVIEIWYWRYIVLSAVTICSHSDFMLRSSSCPSLSSCMSCVKTDPYERFNFCQSTSFDWALLESKYFFHFSLQVVERERGSCVHVFTSSLVGLSRNM